MSATKTELVQENENIIWVGETGFEADADRVIVLIDEFKSGYECLKCGGKDVRKLHGQEVSVIPCPDCGGKGTRPKAGNAKLEVKCSECDGEKVVPCPDCKGKGGALIIPEKNEGAPATGRILSIGPLVPAGKRKLGERVMFGSWQGMEYGITGKMRTTGEEKTVNIRILRDEEIACKLHGVLKLKDQKSARALYTNA